MEIDTPENLEQRLDILRKKVINLPESYKSIGEKALELVQQENITHEDYIREMQEYPELRSNSKIETTTFKKDLLYVVMLAGDIITKKEGLVPV